MCNYGPPRMPPFFNPIPRSPSSHGRLHLDIAIFKLNCKKKVSSYSKQTPRDLTHMFMQFSIRFTENQVQEKLQTHWHLAKRKLISLREAVGLQGKLGE